MIEPVDPKDFDFAKQAFPFKNEGLPNGINVTDTSVTFVLQRGPVKEYGNNGCQIDDMIKFVRKTLEVFNSKVPCRENSLAITKLQEAELWLLQRYMNRVKRDVEGTSKL